MPDAILRPGLWLNIESKTENTAKVLHENVHQCTPEIFHGFILFYKSDSSWKEMSSIMKTGENSGSTRPRENL